MKSASRTPVPDAMWLKSHMTNKDPENIVTINGERCIGLSVYKAKVQHRQHG
ncbi:MAG: hypothetical protein R2727_01050 [Bacteroidales bacterium]